MRDKRLLRMQAKEIRAQAKSAEKDMRICANLQASAFLMAQSFFVYRSVGSEVDTQKIIEMLDGFHKNVCVPRVVDKGSMYAVPRGEEELKWGIPQPKEGEDTSCEIVLTPLLLADVEGNRLGYGGGYYDRYFALHPEAVRVGVAYSAQIVSRLEADEWDLPLDFLLTEEGLFRCKKGREEGGKLCDFYS